MPQKSQLSARAVAVEILCLWATTHDSIEMFFHGATQQLADIDRGLVKTLVYGVLRQKEYLDAIIRKFSRHPLRKMKPRTLMTLRIGIYQLLFLNRIPGSAAVNATVDTLKTAGQPSWLIGFVNGLLRNVVRQRNALPCPEEMMQTDVPIFNHPSWIIERWQHYFGMDKTRMICQVNAIEPPLMLRVNNRRTSRSVLFDLMGKSGITVQSGHYSPFSLHVKNFPGGISSLPAYSQGHFQVQDEAAQLASLLIGPLAIHSRVLDACAGLGGKTSHLIEMLPLCGSLIALEPDRRRFRLLQENLYRLGHVEAAQTFCISLQGYAAANPQCFDAILVDAPCSGTGVIRRQPDIRWNRQPDDLSRYQKIQLELLRIAASLIKPDGVLVYSTCSLEPEENEDAIHLFLQSNPNFIVENAKVFLPESAHSLVDSSGFFHPTPDQGLDGFFAVRMVARRNL